MFWGVDPASGTKEYAAVADVIDAGLDPEMKVPVIVSLGDKVAGQGSGADEGASSSPDFRRRSPIGTTSSAHRAGSTPSDPCR